MLSANELAESRRVGSTMARLPWIHLGSMGLSHGLLIGNWHTSSRTPIPFCLTVWLCARIQDRTSLLICHDALSQIRSQTGTCCCVKRVQHHSRNWMVMALTGRRSTKRSQTDSSGS